MRDDEYDPDWWRRAGGDGATLDDRTIEEISERIMQRIVDEERELDRASSTFVGCATLIIVTLLSFSLGWLMGKS